MHSARKLFCHVHLETSLTYASLCKHVPVIARSQLPEGSEKVIEEQQEINEEGSRFQREKNLDGHFVTAVVHPLLAVVPGAWRYVIGCGSFPALTQN